MLFTKACFIGLMIAIPIGPVALLLIQRTLKVGKLGGFASGLGAAVADGLFGLLAAIGLVTLLSQYGTSRPFLRPLGGLALIIVGAYFFRQKPRVVESEEVLSARFLHHYFWDFFSTFFLALMNPGPIVALAAIFAGSDLIPEDPRKIQYAEIASGIFTGSLCWWLFLVGIAQSIKKRLSTTLEHRLLQITGAILISLGLITLLLRVGHLLDKAKIWSRFFS